MLKKSLLGAEGDAGDAGTGDSSRETLNVEVVPSSLVFPDGLLML